MYVLREMALCQTDAPNHLTRSPEIVLLAEDVTVPLVAGQLPLELHAALGALQAARVPLPLHRREVKLVHDPQPATRAQRRWRRGLRPGAPAATVGGRVSLRRRGTDGAVVLARRRGRRVLHGAAGGCDAAGGAAFVRARDPVALAVVRPDPAGVTVQVRGPRVRRWRRRSARRRGSRRRVGSGVATEAHGLTGQVLLLMLLERMERSGRGRWGRRSLKYVIAVFVSYAHEPRHSLSDICIVRSDPDGRTRT